jgi:hypothetical protein
MSWDNIKAKGNKQYKTAGVEPIDLYRDGGILQPVAVAMIIKYAFRNRKGRVSQKDIDKIIHYAEMLGEII